MTVTDLAPGVTKKVVVPLGRLKDVPFGDGMTVYVEDKETPYFNQYAADDAQGWADLVDELAKLGMRLVTIDDMEPFRMPDGRHDHFPAFRRDGLQQLPEAERDALIKTASKAIEAHQKKHHGKVDSVALFDGERQYTLSNGKLTPVQR